MAKGNMANGVGSTTFTTPSDLEIVATRVADAPRRLVWEAWTRSEHVPHWMLGPEGWSMPICEMDVRPGGAWHYGWRGADRKQIEMRGVYREIRPPERLVQTESWGGDWPETLNTLVLTEQDGKTTMVCTVLYPSKNARDAALGTGMKEGWAASYDRLDRYLRELQQTPGETSRTIAESMLEEFEQELGTTRRFLQRVPEGALMWRPHEKSMTAGQLALHIAQVPAGVLKLALEDQATPPDFSTREQPGGLREVLDQLERSAAYVRQTLPAIDDDRMRGMFRIVQDGRTLVAMPRAAFLRSIMLNHWYHHRGQLGAYLRLLGAAVPSSYGPSADE